MQLKWPMLWDLFSLFPAHAGVIPWAGSYTADDRTFPRTRGGDPKEKVWEGKPHDFSPHTRG